MISLPRELRRVVREMSKNPGSTATIIVALALGIAVNAAVFSLVDAVLFRPLPGKEPQRLVELQTTEQKRSEPPDAVAYPIYQQYRDAMKGVVDLAAYHVAPAYLSTGNGEAQQVMGELVTGNFFQVLGVSAMRGRLLSGQDDGARGSNPVVVLSDRLWRRRFGAQNVLGSSLLLNGHSYTVIGVAPPELKDFDRTPEFWIPMSMAFQAATLFESQMDRVTNPIFFTLGRLAKNVSLSQAQSRIDAVDAALGSGQEIHLFEGMEGERTATTPPPPSSPESGDYMEWHRPWGILKPAEKKLDPEDAHLSWLLLSSAGLVVLLACVDVAGLLIARSVRRQKETAIRLALGASRLQLLRQRLLEGIALALAGATIGVLLALWAAQLLLASAPASIAILASGGSGSVLNLRVIGFILIVSLFVAVLLSLLTTWHEAKVVLLDSLKNECLAVKTGLARRVPLQSIVVAMQIAISFVLLSSAGLLLRTLQNRAHVDLGYKTDHLMSAWLDLSRFGYDRTRAAALLPAIQENLDHVPGVEVAALRSGALWGWGEHKRYTNPAHEDCSNLPVQIVGPGYFSALELPLLRGRGFSPADSKNAPGVAVVNEAAAALCWPQKDALHEYLRRVKTQRRPFEIVGVVGNMKFDADNDAPAPLLFVPLSQFYEAFPFLFRLVSWSAPPLNRTRRFQPS